MNTPPKGKRRHNKPELAARYAQKKGPTKAQKRLAARRDDYKVNRLSEARDGFTYHMPGSLK